MAACSMHSQQIVQLRNLFYFKSIVSFSAFPYQKLSPVMQGEAVSQVRSHLVLIVSPQNHMLKEVC